MNKIYLDKLCDFALTTYKNYEHTNKNFDLDDYINNIKQNFSLNEKGMFLKHNFVELKMLFPDIEYEQMILINPLCFNLSGNIEWLNFLNGLLTILNDNYLHESNLIKKTILETADKTFRKKINILNNIDDTVYDSVCKLTNITLILLNKQDKIKLFNHNEKINKVVIMVKNEKEYYCVINWNQKYYKLNSEFVKYLVNNNNIINDIGKNKNTDNQEFITVVNKKKKKNTVNELDNHNLNDNKKKYSKLLNNNNIFDNDNDNDNNNDNSDSDDENKQNKVIKNNNKNVKNKQELEQNKGTYEELQAEENYAMYISEVVDNNTLNIKENNLIDKKKKKNNKNVFVTTKQENNTINKNITNDVIKEFTQEQSSIFNKTEKLNVKELEKICDSIKVSMTLDTIQSNALKLGINIVEGSTKTGKPKNKTKSELIEEIREFAKNLQTN